MSMEGEETRAPPMRKGKVFGGDAPRAPRCETAFGGDVSPRSTAAAGYSGGELYPEGNDPALHVHGLGVGVGVELGQADEGR